MITSPVDSSTMSTGATRFTASSRMMSSTATWIHSIPSSTIFRTAAPVNFRSLRVMTLPLESFTSLVQR